jgi:hypothetical protein
LPLKIFVRFLCCILFFSCAQKESVRFPVKGADVRLFAKKAEAAGGLLDFSKPKKFEYFFEVNPAFPVPASLEIEYGFSLPPPDSIKENYQLVFEADGNTWALPLDLAFLGSAIKNEERYGIIHYAVPVDSLSRMSLSLVPITDGVKMRPARKGEEAPRIQIRSLAITERWFGFRRFPGQVQEANPRRTLFDDMYPDDAGEIFVTPFVWRRDGAYVIDPPHTDGVTRNEAKRPRLSIALPGGQGAVIEAGKRRFEILPGKAESISGMAGMQIPLFAGDAPVLIAAEELVNCRLDYAAPPPFPAPLEADPGLILEWPSENWRNAGYEIFRWPQFPSILIFDTADYTVQDRLLKRLAFFTEKAGFRGRLASDAEIAELHGWNAHDYRAEDLARFFEAARKANFPLLDEERRLERILNAEGIIHMESNGAITAGEGAVISISRESAPYLRGMFMAHEAFHGIFFIDEDFRAFSRSRWEGLDSTAKRFITSYFDYQHYDIKDNYLMVNEFMAHVLQQPVSQVKRYFGETLPARLETSPWRRSALPEKDSASNTWPALAESFTAEAEAFSAYVNRRWGLAAGRVRMIALR